MTTKLQQVPYQRGLALNETSQCWQEATAEAMELAVAEDLHLPFYLVISLAAWS